MAEQSTINQQSAALAGNEQEKSLSLIDAWKQKRIARQAFLCRANGCKVGLDRLTLASIAVSIILAVMIVTSIFYFRPRILDLFQAPEYKQDVFAQECIERARELSRETTHIQKINLAFFYLKTALEKAMTLETKNDAALAMGEYLITRSKDAVFPYALMARQYLVALLDVETRPDIRIRAYKALASIAYLMQDFETMTIIDSEARELISDPNDKAYVLLRYMDLCLEKGTFADMQLLLAEADEFDSSPAWHYEFALRKIMVNEQILLKEDWFEAWVQPGEREFAELRAKLLEDTIDHFMALSASGISRVTAEALFRIGRLYFHEEQYEKARQFFGKFLRLEPAIHQADTLLMMTKSARKMGRMAEAEELITTLLAQFPWESAAADEFLAVVEEVIERGRLEQALEMIENYSRFPVSKNILSGLLSKAGDIALALGRYGDAEKYYKMVIDFDDEHDFTIAAMLALANMHFRREDIDGARYWLLRYLNRFPFEAHQGDALFALLDIESYYGTSVSDVISIALTAVKECPDDPRALGALMAIARNFEEMGMPELAAEQYNKITLLYYIHESLDPERADEATVVRAMLGNARNMIALGDHQNAGLILRKLCAELKPGVLQAEALYLWAMLALEFGQKHEARRRLHLIDKASASSEIAARADIKLAILDMGEAENPVELVNKMINAFAGLSSEEHAALIKDSCIIGFNLLHEKGDIEGMQIIFDFVVSGDLVDVMPSQQFNMKIGNLVMVDHGVIGFITRMEKNKQLMEAAGVDPGAAMIELIERARNIEEYRAQVEAL